MAKTNYTREYYLDQDRFLAPKATSTGGKRKPGTYPSKRQVLLGQTPPGIPLGCAAHSEWVSNCKACRANVDAERQAVDRFISEAGVTALPPGCSAGGYNKNREKEDSGSLFNISYHKIKPARDGSLRLMATDVWWCMCCGACWLTTIKTCGICTQPRGRKMVTKAARSKMEVLMSDAVSCEVCGFKHIKPAPKHCVKCWHVLGVKATKDEIEMVRDKDLEARRKAHRVTKAQEQELAARPGAQPITETSKTGGKKMATKKSAAKGAPVAKTDGPEFAGRPITWWEDKAMRYGFYLMLTNDKNGYTDEEMFERVQDKFPKNGSISAVAHIGWVRGCLCGNFTANPRPKYVPAEACTSIPDRLWMWPDGERRLERPTKAAQADAAPVKAVKKAAKKAVKKTSKKVAKKAATVKASPKKKAAKKTAKKAAKRAK